jgi:hypothetical protein
MIHYIPTYGKWMKNKQAKRIRKKWNAEDYALQRWCHGCDTMLQNMIEIIKGWKVKTL